MKSKILALSKNEEFKKLLQQKKVSNKYVTIYFGYLNNKNKNRFNISFVTKKKIGNAVIRNKIKRIVYCSSMARYGNIKIPFSEEDQLNPVDPYGVSKVAAENILKISEIMQIAYSLRSIHLADPDYYPVPKNAFLDKNIAKELLLKVNNSETSSAEHFDPQNLKIKENTTHYSVVDKHGNAVSNTTTLNTAYGSGVVIKGTGLLMNNEMDDFSAAPNQPNYFELLGNEANKIEPKKRMLSSMTPTILLGEDDTVIATGSPGGSRIINIVLQIVSGAGKTKDLLEAASFGCLDQMLCTIV